MILRWPSMDYVQAHCGGALVRKFKRIFRNQVVCGVENVFCCHRAHGQGPTHAEDEVRRTDRGDGVVRVELEEPRSIVRLLVPGPMVRLC